MEKRGLLIRMALVILTAAVFITIYRLYLTVPFAQKQKTLHVLSYSTFLNSWGPGREIALAFERESGIKVEYRDAGDAGLLLRKLELFPSDVVLGLDQLTIAEARKTRPWKKLAAPVRSAKHEPEFLAFDYSPMTFVYRREQGTESLNASTVNSIDDLTQPQLKDALVLEDPRSSSPGLQFLYWILDVKGVDEGFEFLAKLAPNVKSVAPSWSAAYGLFTKNEARFVFSYLTSPVYHAVNEQDDRYQALLLKEGLPLQIEYMGVPENCIECDAAQLFVQFLLKPEIQKLIMTKNYMLPIVDAVVVGTPFSEVLKNPHIQEYKWRNLEDLQKRRDEILERWRKTGL